jgi:hypothetical protein
MTEVSTRSLRRFTYQRLIERKSLGPNRDEAEGSPEAVLFAARIGGIREQR